MRPIWNSNLQHSKVFQNLKYLEVSGCNIWVNLGSCTASFRNLTDIVVFKCEALVNFVTLTTAKSLVNLKHLTVRHCNLATEIVANEESDSQVQSSELIFNSLVSLKLGWLSSLTCFCSASCVIKFPSLEEVFVEECPRLKIFSQFAIIAPKLKRVYLSELKDKWRWETDLNTTIQHLHIKNGWYYSMRFHV